MGLETLEGVSINVLVFRILGWKEWEAIRSLAFKMTKFKSSFERRNCLGSSRW